MLFNVGEVDVDLVLSSMDYGANLASAAILHIIILSRCKM